MTFVKLGGGGAQVPLLKRAGGPAHVDLRRHSGAQRPADVRSHERQVTRSPWLGAPSRASTWSRCRCTWCSAHGPSSILPTLRMRINSFNAETARAVSAECVANRVPCGEMLHGEPATDYQ